MEIIISILSSWVVTEVLVAPVVEFEKALSRIGG